ncbi:MAG: MDR family MFS transporter [Ilumatobacteraceae bacterium]
MSTDAVAPTNVEDFDPVAVRPVVVGVLVGISLAAVSQTFVTTALPTIVGELGGYDQLSWVVSSYLLTSAIVVPFAGKLSDRFGASRVFRASIAVFAIGSLLAGVSTSMVMLIIARGVQGVGGGALMTVAFTLIARLVPPRERGRYQSRVASLFAVTSVTGPLIGGFFVDHLSWRWAFFVVTAMCGLALGVVRRLPSDERAPGGAADVLGASGVVVVLVSLMLVALWGGQVAAWSSPLIVVLLTVSAIGIVLFVVWERRVADPIVPVRLMRRRAVWIAVTLGFLSGVSMFGVIAFAPTFLQVSLGASATASGLLLVPLMGCILIGSTTGGRVMSNTGRYRRVAIGGSVLLTVGAGLLTTMSADTPLGVPSLYVGVVGLGIGLLMPVTLVAVQNEVPADQLGAATSLTQFTRKIGSTLGVAVLGGLFVSRLTRALDASSADLPAGVSTDSLLETPAAIDDLPNEIAQIVRGAVADGATVTFVFAFIFAACGVVLALMLPDTELADDERAGVDSTPDLEVAG